MKERNSGGEIGAVVTTYRKDKRIIGLCCDKKSESEFKATK